MAIISIHETTFDDQRVYVEATVEDMVLNVHAQTMILNLLNTVLGGTMRSKLCN